MNEPAARPSPKPARGGVLVQRLLALAALGWLVFDFPLLMLWSSNALALFVWWGIVVAALAWLMERPGHDDGHGRQGQDGADG